MMNDLSPRLPGCGYPCANYATGMIKTMRTQHYMTLIKES